jgi:hypothetical protein
MPWPQFSLAPGVIGEAGNRINEALELIQSIPAVQDLARFVEATAVPNFDFMDAAGYREKVEGALNGYLGIKDLELAS